MESDFIPLLPASSDDEDAAMQVADRQQRQQASQSLQARAPIYRTFGPWHKKPLGSARGQPAMARLNQEIVDFVEFISPTFEEHHARSQVVERVRTVVDQIFNKTARRATVHVFGSFETRLYLPSSDIDIVIELETEAAADAAAKPPLNKLASALVKAGVAEPGRCKCLVKARVPIVKFTDKATDFSVDVSFNTKGVDGVFFVRRLLEEYPAVKPLVLLLKQFLFQRSLNEPYTGGIGSYALICMLVSFFQLHPLIQGGFIRPRENLGVLLMDFFELYGKHFNYDAVGISVLARGYFDKSGRGWEGERKSQLAIEDPQNPENDLCKGSFAYNAVRQAFEHAFALLQYALRQNGPEDSLVACIVNVSDETLRHRFYIEQTTNI